MNDGKRRAGGFVLCVLSWFVLGCGPDLPELGYVTGTVTMNGKPLEGVVVEFRSEAGGRPGIGVTDSEGHYELTYTGGVEGTKVGPATVSITTQWPEGEPPPGQRERIPAKYNTRTTLKETVEPGDNVFDFDLDPR
jgi:hypothetical protein